MRRAVLVVAIWGACAPSIYAQFFTNLNFESGTVSEQSFYTWSQALPGWTGWHGSEIISYEPTDTIRAVRYNGLTLANGPQFVLFTPAWNGFAASPGPDPDYALGMVNGFLGLDTSHYLPTSITQSGPVPSNFQSIRMRTEGIFRVFLGGTEVPMFSLGGGQYAGDASAFAGMVTELKIFNSAPTPAEWYLLFDTLLLVDDITFSPSPVSEPSSAVLLVGAGATLLTCRRIRSVRLRTAN